MFAAWRTFFERISEQGTVTLVFEDMHLADSGLIDFIEHLLDWSRGHPIYVVTLSRPELLDRRPDWGAGKRTFTSIYLEPLSPAEMRNLLAGLVPGLPESAAAAIIARADGIPLYAVETVRMLVADGRLAERDGRYEPVDDLGSLAVPETLTALIRSRLDGLEPNERALIADAAVVGQTFTVPALGAVSGMDRVAMDAALKHLVKRELLVSLADPRSAERGQYGFVQGLIREVAYNTLSKRDRKNRHLAAARHYEQIGSDELAGALAGHYVAAHDNASETPEADALAGQARLALVGAADRACALGSFAMGVRFFEQALPFAANPAEVAELHDRAADAATQAGQVEVAVRHAAAAEAIWREAGDLASAARSVTAQGTALLEGRLNQVAIELLEPSDAEFANIRKGEDAAQFKWAFSRALTQALRPEEGLRVSEEGLVIAESGGLVAAIVKLFISKAHALTGQGRIREATALINGAVALARTNGLDRLLAGALTVTSAIVAETEPQLGWSAIVEAAEIARRMGQRDVLGVAVGNALYTGFTVGEWEAALALAAPFVDDVELVPGQRVFLLSNLIILRANRGEDFSAELEEMRDLIKASGDEAELAGTARDAYANIALAAGDLEEAADEWRFLGNDVAGLASWAYYQSSRPALWLGKLDHVRTDVAKVERSSLRGPTVDARLVTMRAGVAALEGNRAKATGLYRDALSAWRSLGLVWDEALTGIDMATVLDPAWPEIKAVAADTLRILEDLRARPYIARLEARLVEPRSWEHDDKATSAQTATDVSAATASSGSRA
jgi:hypothetical protein